MFDLILQSKVSVPAAGWHWGNEEGGLEVAWYNMGGGGGVVLPGRKIVASLWGLSWVWRCGRQGTHESRLKNTSIKYTYKTFSKIRQ